MNKVLVEMEAGCTQYYCSLVMEESDYRDSQADISMQINSAADMTLKWNSAVVGIVDSGASERRGEGSRG